MQNFMAHVGAYVGQAGVETLGYVGEEAVARMITGELDSNTSFQEYMANLPTDASRGLTYFAMGELLGAGLVKGTALSVKGASKVFSKLGFREVATSQFKYMNAGEVLELMVKNASGDGDISSKDLATLKRAAGFDDKQIKKSLEFFRDARLKDAELEPAEFKKLVLKGVYGMETEVNGDAVLIKSFGGDALEKPINAATGEELLDAMRTLNRNFQNAEFELSAKLASDRDATLSFEIRTQSGTEVMKTPGHEILNMFSPESGTIDPAPLKLSADRILGREDIKIQPIEGYFNAKFKPKASVGDTIFVPKSITSADEAAIFGKEFFLQMKRLNPDVEVNTRHLESILRGKGGVKYDESFLKLTHRWNQIKSVEGGKVSIKADKGWTEPMTVADAGRQIHMSTMLPIGN